MIVAEYSQFVAGIKLKPVIYSEHQLSFICRSKLLMTWALSILVSSRNCTFFCTVCVIFVCGTWFVAAILSNDGETIRIHEYGISM